jgi:hypothetical protein
MTPNAIIRKKSGINCLQRQKILFDAKPGTYSGPLASKLSLCRLPAAIMQEK